MSYLSRIKHPIIDEMCRFEQLFDASLTHEDGLLGQALAHIRGRGGKCMRPMLILLTAKHCGGVNESTLHAAVGLELLHTASLVHDDVVDESRERRGQPSVNESYDNKVAVLVGDYVLSTSLLHVSYTHNEQIFREIARLGQLLANGEILQLTNTGQNGLSEQVYYDVIRQKTAALFESCCAAGAISAGVTDGETLAAVRRFGQDIGTIFQIRDDIFDYFDSKEIGKPTGNDMQEGKLTLPILYALRENPDVRMLQLAHKVKAGSINADEIADLVSFAKAQGGIEYATRQMEKLSRRCHDFIEKNVQDEALRDALQCYVDYVSMRNT